MRRLGVWLPIFAGVVVGTGGLGAAGCGGDSAPPEVVDSGDTDGTLEVGSDTGVDSKGTSEASPDVSDAGKTGDADATVGDADATTTSDADASMTGDADATVGDADATTTSDADATTTSDADAAMTGDADASTTNDADAASPGTDAESDGSLAAAYAFPGQVAAANCDRIAACCGTSGDAAAFNWAKCIRVVLPSGFNGSNASANLIDGGHVTFDPVQAQTCLSTFAAIDCVANDITQALEAQLYQSCFLAYQGTLAAGAPCNDAIECATGNFCDPADSGVGDGGAIGICAPLRDAGDPCSDFGNNISKAETACSYRGSTNTGLHCRWATTNPPTILNPASWVCATANDVDGGCVRNEECTTHLCTPGPGFTCVPAETFIGSAGCNAYLIADAGGGG